MKDNLTIKVSDEVESPAFLVGAVMPRFSKDNFYKNTIANWKLQNRLPILQFKMETFISESGSEYIFEKSGVWRISSHWENVGSCEWNLCDDEESILNPKSGRYKYIGFCRWSEFSIKEDDENSD